MATIIPPARVRQEDAFFINSLASTYANRAFPEPELRDIVADALRMIRHLASRYSDPTCVELNGEELEAEGRKKFLEQITKTRVLDNFPQRLREDDVITAINGNGVSNLDEMRAELALFKPGDQVIVDYYRPKKDDVTHHDMPGKNGAVRVTLGGDDEAQIEGVSLVNVTEQLRKARRKVFLHFPVGVLGVFVNEVDMENELLYGRTPNPPSRGELFLWLKSCINNHIRGIVHRCRFTVRRTGRKVPAKDSKLEWNRSFKPEVSLEAASEDDHLNRAVERAASMVDASIKVAEFDEDMGLSRYGQNELSHSANSNLTVADLSRGLRLNSDDLIRLADSYRRRLARQLAQDSDRTRQESPAGCAA